MSFVHQNSCRNGSPTGGPRDGPRAPRLVFWETTAACNLHCAHCRRLDVTDQPDREELDTAPARSLLDDLADIGQPILVLSGGEPLVRGDLFELIAHACGVGLPVALATNGTLVDAPMADRIVASGVKRVAISIDGADAATHDRLRAQPGCLARALAGADHLKARGMSVQFNCTVTRHNVHQLESLHTLALDRGADALHLFMLVPVGCGMEIAEASMLSPQATEDALTWLATRSTDARLQVKATCAPQYYRILRQRGLLPRGACPGSGGGMGAVTRGCLAGTGVCFVSHRGDVFPCGYLPVLAGNVRETSIRRIWHDSPVFQRLRRTDLLTGTCGACEFVRVCGGCRARAYAVHGDYMAEDPHCPYVPARLRGQPGEDTRGPAE